MSTLLILLVASTSVVANNSLSQAYTRNEGTHYDEYVCYPDCSGTVDQYDWFKTYVYSGDVITFSIYNTGNPNYVYLMLQCYSSSGSAIGSEVQIGDRSSGSCGMQGGGEGYRYIRLRTLDGWGDDATYYDVTISIDKTNRDRDGDGYKDSVDDCDYDEGDSYQEYVGCSDYDGDGWADFNDDCEYDYSEHVDTDGDGYCDGDDWNPNDETQWEDADGDGYGDNCWGNAGDCFSWDRTQWFDNDGDGFGDNPDGNEPDHCRFVEGYSDQDRNGCPDYDNDGWSDPDAGHAAHPAGDADAFPYDDREWQDTDSDDYGDNEDKCPNNAGTSGARIVTSDAASRAGVHGLEVYAWDATDSRVDWIWEEDDTYLQIATDDDSEIWYAIGAESNQYWTLWMGCTDTDGDGFEDDSDAFPVDGTQWSDSDGDGFGDNMPHPVSLFGINSQPNTDCQEYFRDLINSGDVYSGIERGFDRVICTAWVENWPTGWFDMEFNKNLEFFCDNGHQIPLRWVNDGDNDCGDMSDEGLTAAELAAEGVAEFAPASRYYHYQDFDIGWAIPFAVEGDACPLQAGESFQDRYGCPDSDGDGWSDASADWTIEDGADTYKNDSTQHIDTDGDEYGDNSYGLNGDACPTDNGYSTIDRLGCPDMDTDGYSDERGDGLGGDDCPAAFGDSTRDRLGCPDSNGDGYSDMNGFVSTTFAKAFDDGDVVSIFILIIPVIVLIGLSVFLLNRRKGGGKGDGLDQGSLDSAMQDAVAWGVEEGHYQSVASTTTPAPQAPPLKRTTPIPAAPPPKSANNFEAGPALPAGGLPEGWTMDQWVTYGDNWLEQNQ